MNRIARIATSFASVLAAYWAYALIVVPWIEPPAGKRWSGSAALAPVTPADQLAGLRELFAPGDWELQPGTILLATDQGKVLFQQYANLPGTTTTTLKPCTILFMPHGDSTAEAEQLRETVILRAPAGAELEFTELFDLARGAVPRLKAARLPGRITIRGRGKTPGPEDDLLVDASDIEFTEKDNLISTRRPIDFAFGASAGRGSEMRIKLISGDALEGGRHHGLNVQGIESFEIRQLERLHLEPAGLSAARGKAGSPGNSTASAGKLPIEITCRGPFRFDALRQVATFQEQVDLRRIHPDGPSDQITCDALSIEFAGKQPANGRLPADTASKARGGLADLEAKRVEARGSPVVIRAPAQNLEARGERLKYDLVKNEITLDTLDGAHDVSLKQGTNEIRARRLQYQLSEPGRLGKASATGPGWLRGQTDARPGPPLEARWAGQLRIGPDEHQQQVISLVGDAELKYGAIGRLSAGEVHLWLIDAPNPPTSAASSLRFQPDRMKATQNVRVEANQFSCAVGQLEVWFEPPAPSARGSPAASLPRYSPLAGNQPAASGLFRATWRPDGDAAGPIQSLAVGTPLTTIPSPGAAVWTSNGAPPVGGPPGRFHVEANLLRINVVDVAAQAQISKLIVEGNVRITEQQTAQPAEKPVRVTGNNVLALDAGKPYVAVTVTGNPAHFEGRGLVLEGPNLNLNAGTNRLWIEGPGSANLPMDRSLTGQSIGGQGRLDVHWQNRMDTIDDRTLVFEDSVVVDTGQEQLRCDTLKVGFSAPVQFADTKGQSRPEIEQVACSGRVLLEGRESDEAGRSSVERIQVNDLSVNKVTGAIRAVGPGRVITVRRQSGELPALGLGPDTAARAQPPANGPQLYCLDVTFRGEMTGDLQIRQLVFHERVRVLYSPVADWNAKLDNDDPIVLGPQGMSLHCDDYLAVTQLSMPGSNARAWGLEVVGNTRAEGQNFTALGTRMTYDQTKGQLVLQGDGRTEAALYQLDPPRNIQLHRIVYWPATKRIEGDGLRSLAIPNLPAPQKANRGAAPRR